MFMIARLRQDMAHNHQKFKSSWSNKSFHGPQCATLTNSFIMLALRQSEAPFARPCSCMITLTHQVDISLHPISSGLELFISFSLSQVSVRGMSGGVACKCGAGIS